MFEPTGSVYLDTPIHRTVSPVKKRSKRVTVASLLAIVGIASMLLSAALAGVHYLVIDPAPTIAAVDAAFTNPTARTELHRELSAAITNRMVGPDVAAVVSGYGIDVATEADLVVDHIIDDQSFRMALDEFVARTHDLMFVDRDGPAANIAPVTSAALDVISRESPRLTVLISPNTDIFVFDTSAIPDLTSPMRLIDPLLKYALLGMIALPLAAAIHPNRHRILAWVGRAWLLTGAATAAATVTLPYLGGRVTGWSTVEIAIRAGVIRFLVPASAVALIGLTLMSAAAVWKRWEQTRTSREGATAALGIGLVPPGTPAHGLLDLASRGLVDAGRTLTNV